LGGIEIAEDVIEYLIVGATAVQVGTASFTDPRATVDIIAGLEKLGAKLKVRRISDLSGCLEEEST
jgi:dihydroorotate dehydrogenase (NAD+) catalytic subunit